MSRPVIGKHELPEATYKGYVTGFLLSVILTLSAYFVVTAADWSRKAELATIFALAVIQFMVQILFFLHLGKETRPRWKQLTFVFMVGVVIIVVLGSIWIMANLDYHHDMTPAETDQHIIKDEGY